MFFIALTSFTTPGSTFDGTWGTSTRNSSFDLYLKQENHAIRGSHISVRQKGKRLDSGADGNEITINGTIDSTGVARVTFKSGYNTQPGTATIKRLSDKRIEWIIIIKPEGSYYIPDHAVLVWVKK